MPERIPEVDATTPPLLFTSDLAQLGSEEWEGWMKWDNMADDNISPPESDLSTPSLQFASSSSGSRSPEEFAQIDFSPIYSIPEAQPAPPAKKRKSSTPSANIGGAATPTSATTTRQPRGQKISHNVIEKRYRSNLNDKIAKLRDSVPELRTATPTVKKRKSTSGSPDGEESDHEDGGLKFNKATVLTKATEYIQQLERQNQRLQQELTQMRGRGGVMEKLRNPPAITTAMAAPMIAHAQVPRRPALHTKTESLVDHPMGMIQIPDDLRRFREANATTEHYGHSFPSSLPTATDDDLAGFTAEAIQGLIPLAEDFRRMREEGATQAAHHYAPESSYYGSYVSPRDTLLAASLQDQEHNSDASEKTFADDDYPDDAPTASAVAARWTRSKAMSRVLVGSLVGLMYMESFSEQDADDGTDADNGRNNFNQRGLFSLPAELTTESRGFAAQIRQRIVLFLNSPACFKASFILAVSLIFVVMAFGVFLYLAPKGSKNVREGPYLEEGENAEATASSSLSSSTTSSPSPSTPSSSSSQKADFISADGSLVEQEVQSKVSSLRIKLDRTFNELTGLDWLKSHHVDEEAFRWGESPDMPGTEGGPMDWANFFKKLVTHLMQSMPNQLAH